MSRDTQFQCFAELLWKDIQEEIAEATAYGRDYEPSTSTIELIIARRAYDLVQHTCENISNNQIKSGVFFHPNAMVRDVPDMTELPKE